MFRTSREFLSKGGQNWNPGQWEWNEKRDEPVIGQPSVKKNNFVTSFLRRGEWNVNNFVVEKTESFRKFSEEQQTSDQVQCPCLPLNRITFGQHKSDNNNRMIQLTDVFCVLLRYKWASNF